MRGLRFSLLALAVALTAVGSPAARGQAPRRAAEGTAIKGKVVRVNAADGSFVVRSSAGKEVTLYSGPRATYRLGNRDIRINDVRTGMTISGAYEVADDRYILSSATFALDAAQTEDRPAPAAREPAEAGERVRGRIIRVEADPNHLVLRTEDGKEMILYLDGRADVTATFETRGGKRVLVGLTAGAARQEEGRPVEVELPARPAEDTRLSGTIVRVVGPENQFVVRTADGREVVFYADPRATYQFDGRAVQFSDLQRGAAVDVTYSVRDRRHYARRVVGPARRGR